MNFWKNENNACLAKRRGGKPGVAVADVGEDEDEIVALRNGHGQSIGPQDPIFIHTHTQHVLF